MTGVTCIRCCDALKAFTGKVASVTRIPMNTDGMVRKRESRGTIARYVGAIAGGIPVAGNLAQELTTDAMTAVLEEQARLRSVALRAAERSAGMTRQEIGDAIVDSPHLAPLVTRVLWMAGMNGHDEILDILGGILGTILLTPDDTEEAELILAGIADLKRVHLQVLRMLGQRPQMRLRVENSYTLVDQFEAAKSDDSALPNRTPDGDGFVMQDADTWNAEALASRTGLSLTRTQMALASLSSAGFALSPSVIDGPGYLISPAGSLVWEAIQRWQSVS